MGRAPAAPAEPSEETAAPADTLAATSQEAVSQTTQLSHFWLPNPQKLCEIIKVCCLKLNLGVIFHLAIDNKLKGENITFSRGIVTVTLPCIYM